MSTVRKLLVALVMLIHLGPIAIVLFGLAAVLVPKAFSRRREHR